MLACYCSLAGTRACLTCSKGMIDMMFYPPIYYEKNKPKERIIEKFDKDGKLIERITEKES